MVEVMSCGFRGSDGWRGFSVIFVIDREGNGVVDFLGVCSSVVVCRVDGFEVGDCG